MDIEIEAVLRYVRVWVPHRGPREVAELGVGGSLARVGLRTGLQGPLPTLRRFGGRESEVANGRFGVGDAEPRPVPRTGVDAPDLASLHIPQQFWFIVIEGLPSGRK